MAQAPIPFQSMRPAARGKLQDFRQFMGRVIDKNEVEKARLTELKSLKSIAQAYGISRAAAESLSYDDINAFVKRMEVERANETMREQQAVRQAQMAQAQTSQLMALEANKRAADAEGRALKQFEQAQAARAGQIEFLDRFMPTAQDMPREFFTEAPDRFFPERRVPGGGIRERRPTFNVATGEVTQATPPALERSPEDFLRRMEGLESPHAKQAAHAEFVRRQQAQQAASTAGLATQIKVNEELRKQAGERRAGAEFGQEQTILNFDNVKFGDRFFSGTIGDKAEAIKAKTGINNANAILRDIKSLKEYGNLREKDLVLSDDDKKAASRLADKIRGAIREEILGPGTVTEQERSLLADQIPDPTAGWDTFSAAWGEEGVAILERVEQELIDKIAGALGQFGVQSGPPQGGTELRSGSNIRNLQVTEL